MLVMLLLRVTSSSQASNSPEYITPTQQISICFGLWKHHCKSMFKPGSVAEILVGQGSDRPPPSRKMTFLPKRGL